MKRILSILLLVFITGLTACEKQNREKDLVFYIRETKISNLMVSYLQVCGLDDVQQFLICEQEAFSEAIEIEVPQSLELHRSESSIIEISGLWNKESEEKINQYMQELFHGLRGNYDTEVFFIPQIQYVSQNYICIQYDIWTKSEIREDDYDIVLQFLVFDIRTGERVFLNDLISQEQCLDILMNTENAIAIEDMDYLYTLGVRDRLGDMSEDTLKKKYRSLFYVRR